jgi:hypothetical protein
MSSYAFRDTVDFDFGRDLPDRFRRLIFATREFFFFDAPVFLRVDFFLVAIRIPRLGHDQERVWKGESSILHLAAAIVPDRSATQTRPFQRQARSVFPSLHSGFPRKASMISWV